MKPIKNSRRSFLGSLAILSAGTVFGSSPMQHFFSADVADLQREWKLFFTRAGAKEYGGAANLPGLCIPPEMKGHAGKAGKAIHFENEHLLAQPVWIFWQNNANKPSDVVITVFEDRHPYKRIATLNRFELEGLLLVSKKTSQRELLLASCTKKGQENKLQGSVQTYTKIKRRSQVHDISYYKDDKLLVKEKLVYNI